MAGLRVEVVVEGGLLVVVGIGVGALGAVAGRVRDLDKAPAVEHKARPPAMGGEPPGPVDLTEEESCCHPLLLVRVEAAVLGGELLCHRFGDDIDVVGHLPVGAYHRPQDLAPLPVGVELGFEAVARVPTKAGVELLGPVVVVLVDLRLAGVDDRVGLVGAVLCVLVAGREGLDVCEGFLVGERAGTAEAAAVEGEVGDDALQDSLSSRGGVLLLELGEAVGV